MVGFYHRSRTFTHRTTTLTGYVQGMSDIASMLIYVLLDEVDAFWCFANWMETLQTLFAIEKQGILNKLAALNAVVRFIAPGT